ncbi:Immediate early response gene 2 protein [Heterocephalus glaber]|uniref:Immediate early response gene 2 protein n=1 Tax=Heterocephalus glaber TaxID=10181 RepID=G5BYV3_HETGA|nr:Immediate early response gene 2 protein [Heterocephalus glaber]
MEVQKEAQRIMTLSVWKMYHSRMQRGGLRLHRSLQLSLVMRSARELYLSAKVEALDLETPSTPTRCPPLSPEPMDTQEDEEEASPRAAETLARCSAHPARVGRKRRSSSLSNGVDAGLVPSKKARLEEKEEAEDASSEVPDRLLPPPAQAEGAFPNLARVLQRSFSGLLNRGPTAPPTAPPARDAKPVCRPADPVLSVLVRAVVAF